MTEPGGHDGTPRGDPGQPSVSPDATFGDGDAMEPLGPAEAFQTLASEVRVAVLVRLRSAERAGEAPLSFSDLQRAAGADSSAGFAYHLRQLSGHFVRGSEEGYVLTPAGRRVADAIADGTFAVGDGSDQAS